MVRPFVLCLALVACGTPTDGPSDDTDPPAPTDGTDAPDTDTDPVVPTDTDPVVPTDSDPVVPTDTDTDTDLPDSDTDAEPTDTDTDLRESDSDVGPTDTDGVGGGPTDSESDSDSETDVPGPTDTDTDTDVPGPTDTDTDVPGPTDTDTDADTDTDLPAWPTRPEDYVFDRVTYLYAMDIPPASGAAACCRDFGPISADFLRFGTNNVDNALAGLAAALGLFVDLQAELTANIRQGGFVVLLDHRNVPTLGGSYALAQFAGGYAPGTNWTVAAAGGGMFEVSTASFLPGTGEPDSQFASVVYAPPRLVANGGTLDVRLALLGADLVLPTQDVRLEGDLFLTPGGAAILDGELSGYVTVTDLADGYNDFVAQYCGCAGVVGPLLQRSGSGAWTAQCQSSAGLAGTCSAPDELVCQILVGDNLLAAAPGICPLVPAIVPGLADLDLDGVPTTFEGLSIGLRVDGAGGAVTGTFTP